VAPFIWPLLGAYIAFALLTWLARPLFDLLLRFSKFGRLALSADQTRASNAIGACLLAGLASTIAWLALDNAVFLIMGIFFGLLMLPVAGTFRCPEGFPRRIMTAYTGVLVLIGVAFFAIVFELVPVSPATGQSLVNKLMLGFGIGVFLSQFLINGLVGVRVRR
jgi:hypothetical protein